MGRTRQSLFCQDAKNSKSLQLIEDERFQRPPAETRTLIEICCSDSSRLGDERFRSKFSRCIRITEADDFTSEQGLRKVLSAISDPEAGRVTIWSATPCTWGSAARTRNKSTQIDYVDRSTKLFDDFVRLLQNELIAFQVCVLSGGDIVKEWPDTNYQWKIKPVFTALGLFNLVPIRFNGCAIGLQDAEGRPYKKPWCLMTTVPQIVSAFHDKRCSCPPGTIHPELCGDAARDSSHYTDYMCNLVHSALHCRMIDHAYKMHKWPDVSSSNHSSSLGGGQHRVDRGVLEAYPGHPVGGADGQDPPPSDSMLRERGGRAGLSPDSSLPGHDQHSPCPARRSPGQKGQSSPRCVAGPPDPSRRLGGRGQGGEQGVLSDCSAVTTDSASPSSADMWPIDVPAPSAARPMKVHRKIIDKKRAKN